MKLTVYSVFITLSLTPLMAKDAAFAQVRPSVQLTPAQVQQISRDLVRSNSQDFFQQGRRQMEEEVETLTRKRLFLQEGVLKISQDLSIQQDLSQFERPTILRPTR
ncbi:hypothetical protein K9N68_20515 [Kovacikia minuta CCNUW1]|uniref:hypothetical protein n=1 Tax=Kovacikia minuta TaxID=2931930 RepID=UPI001CCA8616|nr:hypothetical protein [Kovacikia minuta]UBF24097.1 hypothetical protein K9N68_20515 [Kovacikia minuta CCNUW1]